MSNIQNLTDSDFESFIKDSTKPVFIDFWAEWCGPCKMMEPVIAALTAEHTDIVFAKINVDENPQATANYAIRTIPTFVIMKNNELVYRHSGAVPKTFLDGKISSVLK
jgi:thioredoxin 1